MEHTKKQSLLLPVLAVLAGNIMWGFVFVFTKAALEYTQPTVLLSHRFISAFLLMNIMMIVTKQKVRLRGKPLGAFLVFCLTEPLCFIFESYGVLYTNAVFSGVMLASVPAVSMIVGVLFLKEKPAPRQLIYVFAPIAGVVIVTLNGSSLGIAKPVGVLMLVGACLSSAFYKAANRSAAEHYSSFERTYSTIGLCTVVFTVWALLYCRGDLGAFVAPFAHTSYSLTIVFLSLFSSLIANLLINYAAGKMPVFVLATLGTVVTLCSIVSGALILHEPVTLQMVLGALLILGGVTAISVSNNKTKSIEKE